jgi:2-polyprenyl-3-methyl-5-hydroxy-6-metoxy-1,4-benzoquinol methylase
MNKPSIAGALTDSDFWDNQWDDRARRSFSYRLLHGRDFGQNGAFLRLFKRHLPEIELRNARVAELGGAVSRYLVDLALFEGAKITAIDYSVVGISHTKELFAKRRVEGEAIAADVFNWTNDGEPFDIVLHFGLLEHFDNPEPLLSASSRLLKQNGLLFFTMPNLGAIGAKLWRRNAPSNYSAHVHHTNQTIATACGRSGLLLQKAFSFGPPLLRMAPPEKSDLMTRLADLGHSAVCIAGTISPSLYLNGYPKLSSQRGFIAVKATSQGASHGHA